ncbi:MAG TPA: hypothetical protein PKD12_03275 [Nitrospira sp.]|nr:hypothetical protein [Nitrospira sp.]
MFVRRWSMGTLLMLSLLLCAESLSAGEPEQVSIQTLLSPQAGSYQGRMVTVEGVAMEVSIHTTAWTSRCTLYGRGAFILEDDTGSIPVDVLGSCFPAAADAAPKDGDRVRLTALVQVLQSTSPRHVRLQAITIRMLESPP